VAYLATGSVTVTPGTGHTWTIIDSDGHSESISEFLIVGTGVLRPLRITDIIAGSDSVRRELMQAGKIGSGDDCVTIVPARVQVVGILGAGGSAADCVTAVLKKGGASEVVVWGSVDTSLMHSDAYDTVATRYGSKICLIKDRATSVRFVNGAIVINDTAAAPCTNPARTGQRAGRIEFLVESLGRYSGDPPPVIASAAAGDSINYEPVLEPDTCALIGIRVTFSPRVAGVRDVDRPPVYLIGAAASWIPPGVGISAAGLARYKAGRDKTIAIVNHYNASGSARALTTESGPPSFAVAAYMGAHLARYLNNPAQDTSCHFAPQTPSSKRSGH
jgi:hypothetical protein